jgi:diaminohydroxyphosphoribosylaminopyrimidine deaminase/5-amino-6-(5-phosphoribosylamino)uracil reductase
VVDSTGRTPTEGPLFDGSAPTLIATSRRVSEEALVRWRDAGCEVVVSGDRTVGLSGLMDHLGGRLEVQELLIEGGPTLAWSAVEEGIVDRFVLYLAPKLLGGEAAPGVLGGKGFETLAEALPLEMRSAERLGPDLKVVADVHRNR